MRQQKTTNKQKVLYQHIIYYESFQDDIKKTTLTTKRPLAITRNNENMRYAIKHPTTLKTITK